MKKAILLCIFLAVLQLGNETNAQVAKVDVAADKMSDSLAYEKPLLQRPKTVSVLLGTQGIGLSGKLAVMPQLNVRLGFSYMAANYNMDFDLADFDAEIKADGSLGNVHLLAEYRPFPRSSFRVVGGFAYFFSGKATVEAQPKGTYSYGDIPITGDQVGKLTGTVDWGGIAPYIGIGLFNSMPEKKFNVTMDLGTYYLSKPKTTLEGTNMLANNKENEAQLDENLKGYRWLPVLQVSFNYRIN